MLKISEHFEYYHEKKVHWERFNAVSQKEQYYSDEIQEDFIHFQSNKDSLCASISFFRDLESMSVNSCAIKSTYYIGLDRFPKLGLNVYIEPKINDVLKIDYIQMLMEALTDSENFDHLEGLTQTKWEEPWIEIETTQQLLLTPFLLAQYLAIVKSIVKKGLKKSYYTVTANLTNRVKGKVLVGQQIKQNILKNRLTKTVCQYQEFGYDTEVNQFLKFVLQKISSLLNDYRSNKEFSSNLHELLVFNQGAFQQISNQSFKELKFKENNPFYRSYNQAIELGNQILKLIDNNISKPTQENKVNYPPFWIDMSKLFELYVFKKLREQFPNEGEVKYHFKVNRQEPDFILNTKCGLKAVVDAKYKPRYKKGNPSMEDARQLAGYTRLNTIYKELGINDDSIIPAYFIYPKDMLIEKVGDESAEINFDNSIDSDVFPFFHTPRKSSTYRQMYLQEIELINV
ncbi:5-methylcytosine restriction system specificity protein McrC [Myroides odoratimimus]|uniref:5-methylcytosine restriction system specificity protein McrC n=2 Tax=Myroides TaxID=76831 RepID=UPI00257607FE|nr:restriction endonuclease [Myroides odoratimimus]MDM1537667.1 restriction endonuclease [Myroides odoratimimus]MDM1677194.1 restriction endonuclease [Myroides odoratimimus]